MQRVKGHENPGGVQNGTETNEHENVNNWTHRVWPVSNYYGTSYPYATFCVGDASGNSWPASKPITYVSNYNGQIPPNATAYGMEGVYSPPAGTPYAPTASYGQTAPNNGTFNYFPATATDYSAAAAAAAAAGTPPPWNSTVTAKAYENYYEEQVAAATAAMKTPDQRLQSLDLTDSSSNKLYSNMAASAGEKKMTTWASIAKQPAKPVPPTSSGGSKKKGPGMPPPPMVPGRHNIDMNPWESKVNSAIAKTPVIQVPPPPSPATTTSAPVAKTAVWNGPTLVTEPSPLLPPACDLMAPPPQQMQPLPQQLPPPCFDVSAPPPALPHKMFPVATSIMAPGASRTLSSPSIPSPPPQPNFPAAPSMAAATVAAATQSASATAASSVSAAAASHNTAARETPPPLLQKQLSHPLSTANVYGGSGSGSSNSNRNSNGGDNSDNGSGGSIGSNDTSCSTNKGNRPSNSNSDVASVPCSTNSTSLSSSSCSSTTFSSSLLCSSTCSPPHSVVNKLRDKNNYNPRRLELPPESTRFFIIKSYSEDDVHRSIKYEIWCSTERGNKRLDDAYAEQKVTGGAVYLFFSVNGSGHFCGVAQMSSPVDYSASSSVWAQDKWKGQFGVRWIYVKDVPNQLLRHIRLENNENKPVTNSRDTQEVAYDKGLSVFKLIHEYTHTTSIFDDFTHYEKRQEEGDSGRRGGGIGGGGGNADKMSSGGGHPPPYQQQQQQQSHHYGGAPAHRPNPFATRGSMMHKDREGGGGSSFSQFNQNRRGGRSTGFTNHRNNHSDMLRS